MSAPARRPTAPPSPREQTLTEFLIDEQRKLPHATGSYTALVNDLRLACKRIANVVGKGSLVDLGGASGSINVQGEAQAKLDVVADEIFYRTHLRSGTLAGMLSEEHDGVRAIPGEYPRGGYLLAFDPLDGSSNIDVNVSVGSIFSVLPDPDVAADIRPEAFLQPGRQQVCAGYAIYGPTTMLVLSLGHGVHGFTLDREIGEFMLTHQDMRVPDEASEFAINASNSRFWEPAVTRYVDECLAGSSGPRGRDFNMRWVASLVAEAHRILLRGGVFLYPRDDRAKGRSGKLRLLYEANPMAYLVEQAGGAASTGRARILELGPEGLHQRVPVILGSQDEVERIARYHDEYDRGVDQPFTSPLFNERSLFVQQ